MEISIHRKSGFFTNSRGRWVPLAILFNGSMVGRVSTGETTVLELPDAGGVLQVGFLDEALWPTGFRTRSDKVGTISRGSKIFPGGAAQTFSVSTRLWVLFDFFDLAPWSAPSRWVFAIERVTR